MNKYIYSLLFFIVTSFCYSQNIDYQLTTSEVFKENKKKVGLLYNLTDTKGGITTIKVSLKRTGIQSFKQNFYYIDYYDKDLNHKFQKVFKNNQSILKSAFIRDDKLHLVVAKYNKENKEFAINLLSNNSGSNEDFKSETIYTINKKRAKEFFGNYSNEETLLSQKRFGEIKLSDNKDFIAVNFDYKSKKKVYHRFLVFDKKLKQTVDYKFNKDSKNKFFEYNDFNVHNDGDIYFLGKSYHNESKKEVYKDKINYHFELYKISMNGLEKTELQTEENKIESMQMLFLKNQVACIGFYTSDIEKRGVEGISQFNIPIKNINNYKKVFIPFSKQFFIDKYGDSDETKIYNVKTRKLFLDDNGEIIVNGEEYKLTIDIYKDANGNRHRTRTHTYGDIIIAKINQEGILKWSRVINKFQSASRNLSFLSYTSTFANGKNHLFINGSDKIKKLDENRIAFKKSSKNKSNLYAIQIDKNGKIDYQIIVNETETSVPFKVNQGKTSENQVVLLGQRKTKKQILKITL